MLRVTRSAVPKASTEHNLRNSEAQRKILQAYGAAANKIASLPLINGSCEAALARNPWYLLQMSTLASLMSKLVNSVSNGSMTPTAKSWTSTDSGNLEMNSTRGNADNWFEPDIKSIVCNTATNDLIKDSQASENFGNLPPASQRGKIATISN